MYKFIKYIVIDVDGTLTDAGIYYDEKGNEVKKFSTKDAAGFFAARSVGIKTIVLTGRKCEATERRMKELKVDILCQDVRDKVSYIKQFMYKNKVHSEEIAYIGDDLNDLLAMNLASFVGCPKDSCKEVICRANYVSSFKGGFGAVRDIIEYILRERGEWEKAVSDIYGIGI